MSPRKELVTEADVRRMAPGVRELRLGADRIATPAALDLAFSRGMRVVYGAATNTGTTTIWDEIKSMDGTYVVQVENGRAVVSRIGPRGPEPFGVDES